MKLLPGTGARRAAGASSPWAGLRSQFLESRDPAEQVRIFDLSARVAQHLHRWAARYPLIRRVRVWPLALSVAAAAPFSPVEALISTARQSLWVFTLDDLFDEERVPQAELERRAERYRAIALSLPTSTGSDSLAAALLEVRQEMAVYPLFSQLGGLWTGALVGTIDAMMCEHRWRLAARTRSRGGATLPAYEEYLENGLYSIGVPPHVWGTLITLGDQSIPFNLDHLKKMERAASLSIRLSNDLQSYAKEVAEGKINALVLLARKFVDEGLEPQAAHDQAVARVRAEMQAALDDLARLQASVGTATGQAERTIGDIGRFVCDFYTQHDYHTFLAQAS